MAIRAPTLAVWNPCGAVFTTFLSVKRGPKIPDLKKKLKKGKASLLFYFSIRPLLATILQSNHS